MMIKKIILAALMSVSLSAADNDLYDNAIGIYAGYGTVGDATSGLYGLRIDRNLNTSEGAFNLDAVQFALDYVALNTTAREYAVRIGANALWFVETNEDWMPFFKIGTGMQFFAGTEEIEIGNHFYGTLGAGIEYQMRPDTSAVLEVVDHYTFAGENSLRASLGLKYSFGQSY
jgi:hypothetical protein